MSRPKASSSVRNSLLGAWKNLISVSEEDTTRDWNRAPHAVEIYPRPLQWFVHAWSYAHPTPRNRTTRPNDESHKQKKWIMDVSRSFRRVARVAVSARPSSIILSTLEFLSPDEFLYEMNHAPPFHFYFFRLEVRMESEWSFRGAHCDLQYSMGLPHASSVFLSVRDKLAPAGVISRR